MSWLRRLSRDRSKQEYQPQDINNSSSNDMNNAYRPQTSRPQTSYDNKPHSLTKDSQFPPTPNSADMLRRNQQPQDHRNYTDPVQHASSGDTMATSLEPPPDVLTRAFNEATKPYQDRMANLQAELDNAHQTIQMLESEKAALHNWIDKRGLRPDLPVELSAGLATNSPVAASTLATQLDRKMTMLNYSLHHLADALPTPPPTSTVTSSLSALLPSISHLSTLPAGPAFAFESLIKLAGNLNSHSTGEESNVDREAIRSFYTDLDEVMVRVVGKRVMGIAESEEDWDVGRDVKRLEKTGAFLRKEMGVRNYFVKSLEAMKGERAPQNPTEGVTRYSSDSR